MAAVLSQSAPLMPIVYHLNIEGIGDVQFSVYIDPRQSFRSIIAKILDELKSNKNLRNFKFLAENFPLKYLRNESPQLFITIGTKMTDHSQTIETKTNEFVGSGNSIPLSAIFNTYHFPEGFCLYILVLSKFRSQGSIALSPTSPETFDNVHSENNDSDVVNTKKKKHKKKKKKKKRDKDKNHDKKRKRPIEAVNHWEFSSDDMSEEDVDSDYSDEINLDFATNTDDAFIPPRKRRKIDTTQTEISKRMKKKSSANQKNLKISNRTSRHSHIRRFDHLNSRQSRIQKRKRKEQNAIVSKPNHLVILLDTSQSMASAMNHGETQISRMDIAWKHIRRLVQEDWSKECQQTNHVSFATFGRRLDIKASALKGFSAENVKKIMVNMQKIDKNQRRDNLEQHTALFDALYELLCSLARKMRMYDNVRILMFTDGENCSKKPIFAQIKNLLKQTKITLDCIQCSRSERDKADLKQLCCKHSHEGRYWNPLTLGDWNTIFTSIDHLYPHKRGFVYDITSD